MEKITAKKIEIPGGEDMKFPMRINRFLALANVASRREADELIDSGAVIINGARARLGDKVEMNDTVHIARNTRAAAKAYIIYNKPKNSVIFSDKEAALKSLAGKLGLTAISDLDKKSEGLVLLTNDGRISRALPAAQPRQTFDVRVAEDLSPAFKAKLEKGVPVGKLTVRAENVDLMTEKSFKITLRGGESAVRNMCESLHRTAMSLRRTSFAGLSLKGLSQSQSRALNRAESDALLAALGIAQLH